jgi:broad specificity phosphatase PhoE
VRHGETVGNSRIRYYGRTDLALAASGRAQMAAARAALLARFNLARFDRVFSSPLERARESARIVAGGGPSIIAVPEFAEVDFGDFEGLTAEEIARRFPAEFARWNRDRLAEDYIYPNGENRRAFRLRVERGLDRIGSALAEGTSLIVAHRGVIRVISDRLTGVRPEIALGSIQVLRRGNDGGWRAELVDFEAHLAPDG